MASNPKPIKYKNNKYVDSLRGRWCQVYNCCGRAEPHHCNGLLHERAMGSKNDYLIVDLCREHHEEAGKYPKTFWLKLNVEPRNIIIQNLINYIESQR